MLAVAVLAVALSLTSRVFAYTIYANDFVNPDVVLANVREHRTELARRTIVEWADEIAGNRPWNVMKKRYTPPSGTKHDYMSWAPYWWPDCSNVGNTTALPEEEVFTKCKYIRRDGEFNPDVRQVNDTGNFGEFSNAALYNSVAWIITDDDKYARDTVSFINDWFIRAETFMKPNMNYGQLRRGFGNPQIGSATGLLDLKEMTKVAGAVLLLRRGDCSYWTTELDAALISWAREYLHWVETNPISLAEKGAKNNHVVFWWNQVIALYIIIDDTAGATKAIENYLKEAFAHQIVASGEQPLEAERTRPYHYRCYNLAALATNARLAEYLGLDIWRAKTKEGATIQTAVDYTMSLSVGNETSPPMFPGSVVGECFNTIGAVAAVFGDPDGKYEKHLKEKDETGIYGKDAWLFWTQPSASARVGLKLVV